MTIQLKATGQHFPVVLFTMLYEVVLTFQSLEGSPQTKTTEQRFPVVVLITLYYVAELVRAEKELSDWFPERPEFSYTDR